MKKLIFRWNRILHRDIGYFTVGLTIIFAISGIALNHEHSWDPSYQIIKSHQEAIKLPLAWNPETAKQFLTDNQINATFLNYHLPSKHEARIFTEDGTIHVDLVAQNLTIEKIRPRPIIKRWILLHRNRLGSAWAIISDVYAGLLLYLAIGGLFMIKGKNGLKWRATIVATTGIILALIFTFI